MGNGRKKLLLALLVILIIFIAYGQTLQMYFYRDDSALLFKLQHPDGPSGSWGVGLLDRGPYRYAAAIFAPFFPLFKMEPFWYFFTGLGIYILATGVFYIFVAELLENKKAAYFSTLVFAAGFIGSESMFLIANSWHNNIGVIFALASFWSYVRYLKKGGLGNYVLSLGIFLISIELIFIRSHSLIFAILALDILFKIFPFQMRKLIGLVVRQVPFWILFKFWYLQEETANALGGTEIVKSIFLKGEFIKLASFFADIGNGLLPDVTLTRIISFITQTFISRHGLGVQIIILHALFLLGSIAALICFRKKFLRSFKLKIITSILLIFITLINVYFYEQGVLWYRDPQSVMAGLLGLYSWILIPLFAVSIWKTKRNLAIALIFGLAVISTQIFGYYIKYPEAIFSTTHRYFTYSFIGYSILFGVVTYLFSDIIQSRWKSHTGYRIFSVVPLLLIVGMNLSLNIVNQHRFVKDISIPTKEFYQSLQSMVTKVEPGSIFYFDVADENSSKVKFSNFFAVGSMPNSTALAIYYNLDRDDIILVENFDELIFKLSNNPKAIKKTYTFFYGTDGLINTTEKVRQLLANGSDFASIYNNNKELITQYEMTTNGTSGQEVKVPLNVQNINSSDPLLIELKLKINPLDTPIVFPYSQNGGDKKLSAADKSKYLQCLSQLQTYYKNVRVTSTSEWKYREVRNVTDNNSETVWQGSRIWWHDNKNEELLIDLGKTEEINRLIWQNWRPELSPTNYIIEVSADSKTWESVMTITKGIERKGDEMVNIDFSTKLARFIKIRIDQTLSDDAPALEEVAVLGPKCSGVDIYQANAFYQNPFNFVNNKNEWETLYQELTDIAKAHIAWSTDKAQNVLNDIDFPIQLDGNVHTYQVIIPPGGKKFDLINLTINIPVKIDIEEIKARNLSLSEMINRGMIKQF